MVYSVFKPETVYPGEASQPLRTFFFIKGIRAAELSISEEEAVHEPVALDNQKSKQALLEENYYCIFSKTLRNFRKLTPAITLADRFLELLAYSWT